jgi:hypothetical protein
MLAGRRAHHLPETTLSGSKAASTTRQEDKERFDDSPLSLPLHSTRFRLLTSDSFEGMAVLADLPTELLGEIAGGVHSRKSCRDAFADGSCPLAENLARDEEQVALAALALQSQLLYSIANPLLYRQPRITDLEQLGVSTMEEWERPLGDDGPARELPVVKRVSSGEAPSEESP